MKNLAIVGAMTFSVVACSDATKPQTVQKIPLSDETAAAPAELVTPREHRPSSPIQPLDQEKPSTDEQVTADIRKGMMDSKMAVQLQNIKVSTKDGKVTLTGVVKSLEEKQKAGEISQKIAGSNQVDNWVEVE